MGSSALSVPHTAPTSPALAPLETDFSPFSRAPFKSAAVWRYSLSCSHTLLIRGCHFPCTGRVHGRVIPMIRILIAEPMTLTREGLVALIERENDIELAATVGRGGGAVGRGGGG